MREVNYDERWKVARDLACKINLWPTVENLRHLDAALRRAKAEVLQEVMELCLRDPLFKQFVEKGFWGAHHVDIVWRHNGQDKQHEADWLKSLWYLLRKLDARAAQIEEGE